MSSMKKLMTLFTLALAVTGVAAALPQPDLLAQIHFAGAQKIMAAPNVRAFTNVFTSPEAVALRRQTVDKLAPWLAGWLQSHAAGAPGAAARVRPLLDDLQTSEWFLDSRLGADGQVQLALSIRLEAARMSLWQETLKAALPAFGFKSSAGWLQVSYGNGAAALLDGLVKKQAGADPAWFSADVNWPRLALWNPKLKALGIPETQLTVTAPDDNFRINGRLLFPENVAVHYGNWQLPTNSLHQPFISLTLLRGVSGWVAGQPWLQAYLPTQIPDQFYSWALPGVPFQTFYAVPVANAAAALHDYEPKLKAVLETPAAPFMAPLTVSLEGNELKVVGAPFFAPFVQAVQEPAGQFLLGGYFPNTPRSKPLPAELFTRLAEKDLLYYHWEITAERLGQKMDQLPQLTQLGLMLTSHKQLNGDSAAYHWIKLIGPTLGNTVTEVKVAGPAEFSFTRKAPGLFTAVELLALGSWLEAGNFPGCDLKMPPRPARLKHPNAHPATPAPAVPHP
jgi:hypothetical protein